MRVSERCAQRNIRQLARQPWEQSPRTNSTISRAAAAEAVQHPPRYCHVSRMLFKLRQGCVNIGCFRPLSVGGRPGVRSQDGIARSGCELSRSAPPSPYPGDLAEYVSRKNLAQAHPASNGPRAMRREDWAVDGGTSLRRADLRHIRPSAGYRIAGGSSVCADCCRGVLDCFGPRTTGFFCVQACLSYHLICVECARKVGDPLSSSLAVLHDIHPLPVLRPTDISFF